CASPSVIRGHVDPSGIERGAKEGHEMKRLRRAKLFVLVAVSFVLAAAAAQAQVPVPPKPDSGGNTATDSVGVVQVGQVTADPASAVTETSVGDAVGGTTATVGSPGGNDASKSGGVVQVGGDNSATRSVGAAQISPGASKTSARARLLGSTAQATAPASIGGSGPTSATDSV